MIAILTFMLRVLKASAEISDDGTSLSSFCRDIMGRGAEVSGEYLTKKRVNSVDSRGKETRTHLRGVTLDKR